MSIQGDSNFDEIDVVQRLRASRIEQADDEEAWIARLKTYLRGDIAALRDEHVTECRRLTDCFELVDWSTVLCEKLHGGESKLRLVAHVA